MSRSRCTTFAMAPFDGEQLTCYLIPIVMFALSLSVCMMFTNNNMHVLTLKMKVKFKEKKNGTCVIQLEMFEFI